MYLVVTCCYLCFFNEKIANAIMSIWCLCNHLPCISPVNGPFAPMQFCTSACALTTGAILMIMEWPATSPPRQPWACGWSRRSPWTRASPCRRQWTYALLAASAAVNRGVASPSAVVLWTPSGSRRLPWMRRSPAAGWGRHPGRAGCHERVPGRGRGLAAGRGRPPAACWPHHPPWTSQSASHRSVGRRPASPADRRPRVSLRTGEQATHVRKGKAAVTPDFPKKTKCKLICMPGSSFMHIVTYKWIQKQYHVRKRKIIRDLRLILETKAPNITGSRLGVAYA
jgi:hypothetical protein